MTCDRKKGEIRKGDLLRMEWYRKGKYDLCLVVDILPIHKSDERIFGMKIAYKVLMLDEEGLTENFFFKGDKIEVVSSK